MNGKVFIHSATEEKFRYMMEYGRILLFCAPCGFGKTTVARELLKNKRFYECSAEKLNFAALSESYDVLLVDNLQLLQEQDRQQLLCDFIRENPQKRFVFLSRGLAPGWLIPFRFSGLMITVDTKEMFFDRDLTAQLFSDCGIVLSETELTKILRGTMGYPLALSILTRYMRDGAEYNNVLSEKIVREIFIYYEEAIYRRFELPLRRFLLDLAPFEQFGTELAKMVSGDSRAGDYLMYIQQNSSMLQMEELDTFCFWPIFRRFLMWEQQREYTDEQQKALFSRGGLYYELHENYGKALEYYSRGGEMGKVSELLIKSAALHPGMGHYEEMESYFFSLSDQQIKTSPSLMQGMSMLCALHADYDSSEKWYKELAKFAAVRDKSDAAGREARSRLTYLDIALPQRGVSGMLKTITTAFRLITAKEIKLPPFSVTSTLPSIMNGGKDFSEWSKKDDLLYATMRLPVEVILGRDGVGLPDCAVAESKFEKGEDVSSRVLTLASKISEIQSKGTPDIEFALVGLLARSQIDRGRAEDAKRTVLALQDRFSGRGLLRFMPNIDALLCRIALRMNDMIFADEWYCDHAPRDTVTMRTMKRYQYLTQAMVELVHGDNEAALLTLAPLEPYFAACDRYIDMIHLKVLAAAAKYRSGNAVWKDDMCAALDIAGKYHFVRTISEYGIMVLPLLRECGWNGNKSFLDKVTGAVREQAVYYPDFLRPANCPAERLTEAEMQVLRLVCADKSNAEIGEILGIKLATVKSHVSHILQKLGVKRRSEAKTAAQRMWLI